MNGSFTLDTKFSGSVTLDGVTHENLMHRAVVSHTSQSYSQYSTVHEFFMYNTSSVSGSGYPTRYTVFGQEDNNYNGYPTFKSYISYSGPKLIDVEAGESFKNALTTGSNEDIISVINNEMYTSLDLTGSLSSFIETIPGVSDPESFTHFKIKTYE